MSAIYPDEGLTWVAEHAAGETPNEQLYHIAAGTGTTQPTSGDTALENEVYRTDADAANGTIEATSNTGEVRIAISLAGGTEVPAGTDVTEFGVFVNDDADTMVWRETVNPTTIESGERVQFEGFLDFSN